MFDHDIDKAMQAIAQDEQTETHQHQQRVFADGFQKGLDWAYQLARQSELNKKVC